MVATPWSLIWSCSLTLTTTIPVMSASFPNRYTYKGMYRFAYIPGGPERTLAPFHAFKTIAGGKFRGYTTGFKNPLAAFGLNNSRGQTSKDVSNSRYSLDEVKLIAMIVRTLFLGCPAALAHLIIETPYNSQAIKICEAIRKLCKILPGTPRMESLGMKIGTFDNFHGKEALYVVTRHAAYSFQIRRLLYGCCRDPRVDAETGSRPLGFTYTAELQVSEAMKRISHARRTLRCKPAPSATISTDSKSRDYIPCQVQGDRASRQERLTHRLIS